MTHLVGLPWAVVLLFLVVFVLNVLPAFAPPTWATMSFIGLAIPNVDFILFALVAAIAATSGRLVLAKLSRTLVRQKILSDQVRQNVDAIRLGIESRPAISFGTFLGYAFTPLPSNYLFIAYGLTSLPLAFLGLPFLIGRFVSYAFWTRTASTVGDWLDWDLSESTPYFAAYFIASQVLLVPAMYCFMRLDWSAVFVEGRIKWLKLRQP